MTRIVRFVAAVVVAVTVTAPAVWAQKVWAQKPATKPAAKVPAVETILDQSFAASGSPAAFSKVKTIVIQAKISIVGQNINGTADIRAKMPNKFYTEQEITGQGKFATGFDGKVGWSRDPINGLRVLSGGELAQLSRSANELISTDWRKSYKNPKMIGIRKVGTANAYAVRVEPKTAGSPVTLFIDTKTKLEVRRDLTMTSPQGAIPTQAFSSDFRVVDGIKIPFKSRQVLNGNVEITQTMQSVRFNVPVDDTLFVKPAATAPKP